jgi:hypothetical protein
MVLLYQFQSTHQGREKRGTPRQIVELDMLMERVRTIPARSEPV